MENKVPVIISSEGATPEVYAFFWGTDEPTTTVSVWMDGEKKMVSANRQLTDGSNYSEQVMAFLKDYFKIGGIVGLRVDPEDDL